MNKVEYAKKIDIKKMSEIEKGKLILFFLYKVEGATVFAPKDIANAFLEFGQNKPNVSRLKKNLLTTGYFAPDRFQAKCIRFTDFGIESLEEEQEGWWQDFISIASESEYLDEEKFCVGRTYLDRLVQQINHSYAHNCYDAAAVLMRRLFEVVLILSYQVNGIESEIKAQDGVGYMMLDRIVANAKGNRTLKLSRIKKRYDDFRNVGNNSAHSITYTASKNDLDDIKIDYRVALEELYSKANLL